MAHVSLSCFILYVTNESQSWFQCGWQSTSIVRGETITVLSSSLTVHPATCGNPSNSGCTLSALREAGYCTACSDGEAFTMTQMLLYCGSLTCSSELFMTITSVLASSHSGSKVTCTNTRLCLDKRSWGSTYARYNSDSADNNSVVA